MSGPNQRSNHHGAIDLHETPALAVRALLRVETLPQCIWEPCCGPGAIVAELRRHGRTVFGTDIVRHPGSDYPGSLDFLTVQRLPGQCTAIVMNPPYNQAPEFIAHAIDLAPEVYALLRLNFYAAVRKGYPNLYDRLAAVHVFNRRLPMMHRAGWAGKKASSMFDHAWFCWMAQPNGKATIDQIDWKQA